MNNGWLLLVSLAIGSCAPAHSADSAHRQPIAKEFRVTRGQVELRGRMRPLDSREGDAEVVLDVRSASRNAEAEYRYRVRVPLMGNEPIQLAMRERRMYALLPREGLSWMSLLTSVGDFVDGLDVVRLDGAGEED